MTYEKKLAYYFKNRGLKQKELANLLGVAPTMISRYLSGTSVFPPEFLVAILKNFPDIDLQYIFTEHDLIEENELNEPTSSYGLNKKDIELELLIIEQKINKIRGLLTQKSHDI